MSTAVPFDNLATPLMFVLIICKTKLIFYLSSQNALPVVFLYIIALFVPSSEELTPILLWGAPLAYRHNSLAPHFI
jgi:hypothetical protein